jgi:hypothetical protein
MFNPSQQDVRRFLCATYKKQQAKEILSPLEAIASDWIEQHPEYAKVLSDIEVAINADYSVEGGQTNPFLHLSMHLTIAEQVKVDQPRGVKMAFELLNRKHNSIHEAHHIMMECLGEMIWNSQRQGLPPDGQAYVESLKKRTQM